MKYKAIRKTKNGEHKQGIARVCTSRVTAETFHKVAQDTHTYTQSYTWSNYYWMSTNLTIHFRCNNVK